MPFLTVDPTNTDQLRAWDGDGGAFWTAHARRFDEGVAAYQGPLIDAAAIGATDTVLDVGCGNGQVTRDCARRGASALGVDLSRSMLEYARHRAGQEQLDNALFVHADAQTHPFTPASFDVAVSRHGSMFFGDPGAAFANIARALRPGGRLVLLTWQPLEHQEWLRAFRSALAAGRDLPPIPTTGPGPLSLGDPDRVRSLLTSAGFADVQLTGLAEPCTTASTPTTRSGSSPPSRPGWCATSTGRDAGAHSTPCATTWPRTRPGGGFCTTRRRGSYRLLCCGDRVSDSVRAWT